MTLVIAYETDGGIQWGADSAAVGGWEGKEIDFPKIFSVANYTISLEATSRT